MTRFLFNSAVLPSYGTYRLNGPVSLPAARAFAAQPGLRSAIGHVGAARFLSRQLGVRVACRRIDAVLHPGDQALVLRLLNRLPEGDVLDEATLARSPHEFALLERLA